MPDSVIIGAAPAHRIGYGGQAWALLHYALGFLKLGPGGRLASSTLEEAAKGVGEILRDYHRHACAARRIVETHFRARIAVGPLLEELG